MTGIIELLPLIDRYASFTRVAEPWQTHQEAQDAAEVHTGLVVRLREVSETQEGVTRYLGVEVHFDDASVLLIKPSDTWQTEAWGDLHQEAMIMLASLGEEEEYPEDGEPEGPQEEGAPRETMYCYAVKDGTQCSNQDHWVDPDMLLRTGYEGDIPEFTGSEHDEDPQP